MSGVDSACPSWFKHQSSVATSLTSPPQEGAALLSRLAVPERGPLSGTTVCPSVPSPTTQGCQCLAVRVVTVVSRSVLCRNTAAASHMQLFLPYIVRTKMKISQSWRPHCAKSAATCTSGYHIRQGRYRTILCFRKSCCSRKYCVWCPGKTCGHQE